MKKTLAILLALAMVFSTVTVAFAEETIGADAQSCVTLGMIKGEGAGVTAGYLAGTPSRLTAAILFLRLKGLEQTALAYTGTENFADVDQVNWAGGKAILGYLKANPQLGWVGDQGKFDPNAPMTAQGYYKVMLEALGYKQNTATVIGEFTWDGVVAFAATHGLSKVATVTNFTVNDVAIATVEALKANVIGSTTKTLAASLVETGVLTAVAATTAGVYTPAAVALAVESVTTNNLKELTVKFNTPVDEDTVVVENFVIDGDDAADVSLADDNMTVTVVLADGTVATAQPANYELEIEDVADVAGKAMADYSTKVRVLDTAIPVLQKMELVGPKTLEFTYSEPIKTFGTVKINNGAYGVLVPVLDGSNVVTVELSASSLPEANYTVKVSGYKDYAGFSIDTTELTLAYVKDTTLPTAKIKAATQTEVKVEFNKPVALDDTNDYVDYFYHTFSTWAPDTVTVNATNTVFTLTFTDYKLPAGTSNLTVKYKGTEGVEIADEWGNELAANIVLPVTVTADTTAPVIKSTKVIDEKTIEIYFSEAMDEESVEEVENYTFKDANGKDIETDIHTLTYDSDEEMVEVVLNDKLDGGNYTVELADMIDASIAENELAKVTLAFAITDKTPIDMVNTADDVVITAIESNDEDTDDVIFVTYGEKMAITGQYSVLNATNYLLDGEELSDDAKLELFGSTGKVVKISIPENADGDAQTVDGADLTIGRVADLTGNATVALSWTEGIGTEDAPVVTLVKQTDYNKLTVVIDKPLKTVVASGFVTGSHEVAAIDSWKINDDNETEVIVTLNADEKSSTADTSEIITNLEVVADMLVAETGKKMVADDYSDLIEDYRAPKLIADTTDLKAIRVVSGVIEIEFREGLDSYVEALMAHDLVITDEDGNVMVAGVEYTTTVNGNILEVNGLAAGTYKVKSVEKINYIRDNDTNVAGARHNKALAFTTAKEVVLP